MVYFIFPVPTKVTGMTRGIRCGSRGQSGSWNCSHLFHLSAREKRWEIAPAWPVRQDLPLWGKKDMPRDVTGNTQESDSRHCATSDRTVSCLMLRVTSSPRSNSLGPSLDGPPNGGER